MVVINCRYYGFNHEEKVIFFVQLFIYKKAGIKCCFFLKKK